MASKTCVICGAPSGMYPLCREHLQEKQNGNILKCEECGTWHYKDKPCKCNPQQKQINKDENKIDKKNPAETIVNNCILCGAETKVGYHFCVSCYTKYSSKSITVQIKNCKEITITDEYGNKEIKNKAGVLVRSLSEKIVSDELYDRGIRYQYEPTVPYLKENGEIGELHPDFYLPDYDLYLEHWGIENNIKYESSRQFKEKIYHEQSKNVAGTTPDDLKDISAAIAKILFKFPKKR